jgi:hypothetical protein
VAAIDARETVNASLARFLAEVRGRGRVVLVDGSRDETAFEVERAVPEVEVIRRAAGTLAPELWSAGLRATSEPFVVLSSAQMAPAQGWLDALWSESGKGDAVAIGGAIEPGRLRSHLDRAVYLLRYVSYHRPLLNAKKREPAGENSLYRRDRLLPFESVWAQGFWEAEVHATLRDGWESLAMADSAVVEFLGGCDATQMIRNRLVHGRRYGAARGARFAWHEKLARTALLLVVPAVLLLRIVAALRARRLQLGPWLPSLPWLALLCACWAAGEVQGFWFGPPRMHSRRYCLDRSVSVSASVSNTLAAR